MTNLVQKPERWLTSFGESMATHDVARLLTLAPFRDMDANKFPKTLPLDGILLHDARIVNFSDGELIIREGDYGSSAFLILQGSVEVVLKNLPAQALGRAVPKKVSWLTALARTWTNPSHPEVRKPPHVAAATNGGNRQRIFVQDMPVVLGADDKAEMHAGEVFGELAALTRTPRTATVVAKGSCEVLEIRWQGLRDLLRYDAALKKHIDALYRANSLRVHLRETPLLERLSPEALIAVADATEFHTFGNFDWQHQFKKASLADSQSRLLSEPLIAEEGDYPSGLYLIRNGFARLSEKCDQGHRTLSYLGKGGVFGLRELAKNWRAGEVSPWEHSLRAVGYVDALRIPVPIVEQYILPTLSDEEFRDLRTPAEFRKLRSKTASAPTASPVFVATDNKVESGLLEFLVENRFTNGTAAMVIDLDRCTRCDDCLRACAATHDNNPRFNREGPKYGQFQIAHACLHCVDPVCMIGCPTGAIGREPSTGQVVINDDNCIGCTTCAQSCPYQNIRMEEIRSPVGEVYRESVTQLPILKATKCDLCVGQIGGPACVNACPHDAMVRLDLHDIRSLAKWTTA